MRHERLFNRWKRFHESNPEIYDLFVRFAQEAASRHTTFAAELIVNRIRWEIQIATIGDDYKINQNFTSLYARKFMHDFPEHEGLFRLRTLRAISSEEVAQL